MNRLYYSHKNDYSMDVITVYESFKNSVLYELRDMDPNQLSAIASAMDRVAAGYTISAAETGLAVVGREQFIEIAATYVIVRRTEGVATGTAEHMARILRQFINAVPKPIDQIRPNDIRAFLFNYQRDRGVSNRTLDMMRTMICTFFKWCAAEGYIASDPASNIRPIKYTRKPRKALTQKELELVRRACKSRRDTALIEVLYSTGCRVAELCSIRLEDIDWSKNEITVLGKGSKYRTVYFNAKAEVAINAYLGSRRHNSEWLFCNDRGGGQMKPANIRRIFSKINQETGIAVTPHIMRHTMATQALSCGTGVEIVQQLLGHADISTTMIYAEVKQSNVREAHIRSVV